MTQKKKHYAGNMEIFEQKLKRVMERLGVREFRYDWNQSRGGSSCWVEMHYNTGVYRFENSAEKSARCGRELIYVSDLFAAVVYSLEGLARAVEQGIFTLDMLLAGVPALPAAPALEPCFRAMGFTVRPTDAEEVRTQYKHLAKTFHPDTGGSTETFAALVEDYRACMALLEG